MNKFKTPQFALAFLYSIALFAVTGWVIIEGMPDTIKEGFAHDVILVLITTLVNNVKSMLHFFDGTTEGSKDKSETLKEVSEQAAKVPKQ